MLNPIIQNLVEMKNDIQYVYDNFISKPYKEPHVCSEELYWIGPSGKRVERANHALRHLVTQMAAAPVLIHYFRDAHPYYQSIDAQELKRIQIAVLFTITGRESEAGPGIQGGAPYMRYRHASAENFKNYVQTHRRDLFSPDQINKYADFIEFQGEKLKGPESNIINILHSSDLMRVSLPSKFASIKRYLKRSLGDKNGQDYLNFYRDLFLATGERILGYEESDERLFDVGDKQNPQLFELCSTNVEACIKQLGTVGSPVPLNFLAQPQPVPLVQVQPVLAIASDPLAATRETLLKRLQELQSKQAEAMHGYEQLYQRYPEVAPLREQARTNLTSLQSMTAEVNEAKESASLEWVEHKLRSLTLQ